jgi:LmeA-like phospholipid-binding
MTTVLAHCIDDRAGRCLRPAPPPPPPPVSTRKPSMFAKLLAVAAVATLIAACSTYVESRVETVIRDALPRVVGPASSYDVQVSGSTIDANTFDRVRVAGSRVARTNAPVIDRIELDLRGVSVDREKKTLTSVNAASGQVRVLSGDLADYLQRRGFIEDAVVRFDQPDRIVVTGSPKIAGLPIAVSGGAEFQGRLVPRGPQLRMTVDYLRIGGVEAPPVARTLLQASVNPIFDTSAYPVPAQIDSVTVDGAALVIAASGGTLPSSPGAAGR